MGNVAPFMWHRSWGTWHRSRSTGESAMVLRRFLGQIRLEPTKGDIGRPYYVAQTSIDALAVLEPSNAKNRRDGGSNSSRWWSRSGSNRRPPECHSLSGVRLRLTRVDPGPLEVPVVEQDKRQKVGSGRCGSIVFDGGLVGERGARWGAFCGEVAGICGLNTRWEYSRAGSIPPPAPSRISRLSGNVERVVPARPVIATRGRSLAVHRSHREVPR
jgi:hypothetical protein